MPMAANRVGALGVAAAVLAVAGLVSVALHDDDGDGRPTAASGDPPVTTTVLTLPPSTTEAPPGTATTTPPSTSSPTTTAARRTTTTRGPRTTAAPATTVTTASPTTPTTGAQPVCVEGQIELTASIDNTKATAGQPVTFTTAIRNRSQSTCFYRGYIYTTTFRDPGGATLANSTVRLDDLTPRPFAPGERLTHSGTWDPRMCRQPPCPPPPGGIYSVTAVWAFSSGRYEAVQQFVVP
jgi:hypothetical protein